jgi:hypothetical protein
MTIRAFTRSFHHKTENTAHAPIIDLFKAWTKIRQTHPSGIPHAQLNFLYVFMFMIASILATVVTAWSMH